MGQVTIKFVRNHDLEYTAYYGYYHTTNRTGSGMALLGTWKVLWPLPEEKIGFGFGVFGNGAFGNTAWQRAIEYEGFGYSTFGTGSFGFFEKTIQDTITGLADGYHRFDIRLKDKAGNISAAICTALEIWICADPATPHGAKIESFTGQTITCRWAA